MTSPLHLKLAANWIEKLIKILPKAREERTRQVNDLARELIFSPKDLPPLFVEPNCQPFNPADTQLDEEESADGLPVFSYFQKFINAKKPGKDGSTQLFLLSDAGMGKTSVLGMFALSHIFAFWPKGHHCTAFKINQDVVSKIEQHPTPAQTVLLLDALDEDLAAGEDVEARIGELLQASKPFYRVILSCRTQFIPAGRQLFNQPHRITLANMVCPVRYLSPFTDAQVDTYLEKRYAGKAFFFRSESPDLAKAREVARQIHSLRLRPLLLNYIDDVLEAIEGNHGELPNVYELYAFFVRRWLDRENSKRRTGELLSPRSVMEGLMRVARHLDEQGTRVFERTKFEELCDSFPALRGLSSFELKGRSLLQTLSNGDVAFAHYSIQEYFVAKLVVEKTYESEMQGTLLPAFVYHHPEADADIVQTMLFHLFRKEFDVEQVEEYVAHGSFLFSKKSLPRVPVLDYWILVHQSFSLHLVDNETCELIFSHICSYLNNRAPFIAEVKVKEDSSKYFIPVLKAHHITLPFKLRRLNLKLSKSEKAVRNAPLSLLKHPCHPNTGFKFLLYSCLSYCFDDGDDHLKIDAVRRYLFPENGIRLKRVFR